MGWVMKECETTYTRELGSQDSKTNSVYTICTSYIISRRIVFLPKIRWLFPGLIEDASQETCARCLRMSIPKSKIPNARKSKSV